MKKISLVFLLLVAACATDLGKVRESWHNATYEEIAARWGPPLSSSKMADGADVHLWRSEVASSSGSSVGVGFGIFGGGGSVGIGAGTGVSVPVGPAPAPHVCERKLTFRDGRVIDQEWLGAPRYCETFKRLS